MPKGKDGWKNNVNNKSSHSLSRQNIDRERRKSWEGTGVPRAAAKQASGEDNRNGAKQGSGGQFGDSDKWRASRKQIYSPLPPPLLPVTQLTNTRTSPNEATIQASLSVERAATKIANCYRRRYRKMYLGRTIFAERLELEDKVNIGMRRLFLFGAIFAMIVYVNSLGIPTEDRRAVKDLLESALDLDSFRDVKSIVELRDALPHISKRVKQFSASRGARFEVPEGLAVLRERVEFAAPVVLSSLDQQMRLDRPSWTLSAWVEDSLGNATAQAAELGVRSIMRQPDSHNRKLNCWGWFHPAQFRHGASDYHTLTPEDNVWEEINTASNPAPPNAISHEVVILDRSELRFYRDGVLLGDPIALKRDLTACWHPDKVELGSAGLALTAVRFYPRALNAGEVKEVFEEGEPLTELATGTELPRLSDSELDQIRGHVDAALEDIVSTVQDTSDSHFVLSSVMDIAGIKPGELDDETTALMFPPDAAPAPVLPWAVFGTSMVGQLSPHERKLWEEGGSRTSGYVVNEWKTDTTINAKYWSVFEDPVFTDGIPFHQLPDFSEGADGLCISFWYKPDRLSQGHGPVVEVWKQSPVTDLPVYIFLEQQLDWTTTQAYISAYVGGDTTPYREINSWRYLTYFEEVSGQTKETFLLTSFVQEAEPVVWRHLAYQYNVSSRSISFYLDGRLVFDTSAPTGRDGLPHTLLRTMSVRELFGNATLLQVKASGDVDSHPDDHIPGKMAQLRVYDRLLQPEEVLAVQDTATWAGGEGVKRCAEHASAEDFVDTKERDTKGRPCSWYAAVMPDYQHVCSSVEAKKMCPVTCKGKRLCHDGSLNPFFTPPAPRHRFRVFDRVMWIKPRKHSGSVICPSRTAAAQQQEILARCRALKGDRGSSWRGPPEAYRNFSIMLDRTWPRLDPVNLWDCDDLEPRMDAEQCAWDDSWLPTFKADYGETESWSISFWVRPKAGSLNMPTNFWFAISLFSELSPPLVLNHWNEADPQLEPWMDTRTIVSDPSRGQYGVASHRAAIWPTNLIDYTGSWTMLHSQLSRRPDGTFQFCATLNALPAACSDVPGKGVFSPDKFLEAIEFTTEMLVSPIEVSSQTLSRSQIQEKYYREWRRMETVAGPAYPEYERATHVRSVRMLQEFDQRIALVAPPLLFQERSESEACVSPVTMPFFQAQKLLMLAAHCRESSCPALEEGDAEATDMIATCSGGASQKAHFGLLPSTFGDKTGYTEFLYTIADNSVLVRGGITLPALNFIDANTASFLIIAHFHVPSSALTTALELSGDVAGNVVDVDVRFQHYGYLKKDQRATVISMYAALFGLIVLTVILNLYEMHKIYADAKRNHHGVSKMMLGEVAYDLVMCSIVIVYCAVTFDDALRSEEVATRIVSNVATVPFFESAKPFSEKIHEFFEAVEEFNTRLAWDTQVDSVAFAIMVLMLVRIIAATAVHPRTGVLTGTIIKTLNDLWHFAILFMIVFLCFGVAANLFFGEREDFADTQTSLQTQFNMLLGELPDDYNTDPRIIVYVCLSSIVMFLLMLNFLLAIIVDGYMQVRTDIEASEAENEFVTDVVLSFYAHILGLRKGWPHKREVAHALRKCIRSERVCARHLIIQGFNADKIRDMISWYYSLDGLATDPPVWEKKPSRYEAAMLGLPTPRATDSCAHLPVDAPPMPAPDASIADKLESIGQRLRQLEGMAQDVSELKAAVIMLVEEHKGDGSFFSLLSKATSRAQLSVGANGGGETERSPGDKKHKTHKHRSKESKDKKAQGEGPSLAKTLFSFTPRPDSKDKEQEAPPAVGQSWGRDVRKRIEESIANLTGATPRPGAASARESHGDGANGDAKV